MPLVEAVPCLFKCRSQHARELGSNEVTSPLLGVGGLLGHDSTATLSVGDGRLPFPRPVQLERTRNSRFNRQFPCRAYPPPRYLPPLSCPPVHLGTLLNNISAMPIPTNRRPRASHASPPPACHAPAPLLPLALRSSGGHPHYPLLLPHRGAKQAAAGWSVPPELHPTGPHR